MAALWPNGQNYPGDVWHEYGPRPPIWTPNGPTSSFHSGIDIGPWSGQQSTWLLSPDDGDVTHAGYDSTFGNRVVVTRWYGGDRVEFWLCHGRTGFMEVVVGQRVSQKQRIMMMGETGKAVGVHIHYEVHVNGTRVDPRSFYANPAFSGGGGTPFIDYELLRRQKEQGMYIKGTSNPEVYNVWTDANGQVRLRLCLPSEASYANTGGLTVLGYDTTLTQLGVDAGYGQPIVPVVAAPGLEVIKIEDGDSVTYALWGPSYWETTDGLNPEAEVEVANGWARVYNNAKNVTYAEWNDRKAVGQPGNDDE